MQKAEYTKLLAHATTFYRQHGGNNGYLPYANIPKASQKPWKSMCDALNASTHNDIDTTGLTGADKYHELNLLMDDDSVTNTESLIANLPL